MELWQVSVLQEKPVLRGKHLQSPAIIFFVGQHLGILKTLRSLLRDASSGQAQRFLNMISLHGLLQYPYAL